jgi:hypothetical protein
MPRTVQVRLYYIFVIPEIDISSPLILTLHITHFAQILTFRLMH